MRLCQQFFFSARKQSALSFFGYKALDIAVTTAGLDCVVQVSSCYLSIVSFLCDSQN